MDQGVPSSAMGARPSTATVVPARAYAAQTGIATAQEAIGGTSASTSAREAQQIRATVEGRKGRVAPPAIATADPVTTGNRAASSAQVGRRTRATDAGFVVLQGIACAMLATQAQRASGSARAAHSTHAMAAVRATTTRASAPATPLHTMALRAKMFVGAVPTVASVMRRGRVRASPDSSEIRARCHVPSPPTGTRAETSRGRHHAECATTPRSNACVARDGGGLPALGRARVAPKGPALHTGFAERPTARASVIQATPERLAPNSRVPTTALATALATPESVRVRAATFRHTARMGATMALWSTPQTPTARYLSQSARST